LGQVEGDPGVRTRARERDAEDGCHAPDESRGRLPVAYQRVTRRRRR
jgi:hypothetical protein